MKKQLLALGAVIVFLTAFAAQTVSAQKATFATVNIGFNFKVGKETFPAGKYVVERLETNTNVLQIRGVGNGTHNLMFANDYQANDFQAPKLVFRLSGEHYYLSQIFLQAGNSGYSLIVPRGKNGDKNSLLAQITEVSIPVNAE